MSPLATSQSPHAPAEAESKECPPVVVTLVHGTILFARGRLWSPKPKTARVVEEVEWHKEGSLFRKRLQKAIGIPCTMTEFIWSGANTEWDRLCAAGADSDFRSESDGPPSRPKSADPTLREHIAKYPKNVAHVLVAHSHGGNVCLAALNDRETRERVRALVCLSTPFINVRGRADFSALMNFSQVAFFLFFMVALFGTIYLTGKWMPKPWDQVVWVGGFILVSGSWALHRAFTEERKEALRQWASTKKRAFAEPRILALLSDGDEALLALKIAEGLNAALRALWRLAVGIPLRIFAAQRRLGNNLRLALPLIGVVVLLFLAEPLFYDIDSPLKTNIWSLAVMARFVGAALLAALALIFLWCFVLALPGVIMVAIGFVGLAFIRWLAFGWPGYLGVEMTAETCPVGTAKVTRLGPTVRTRGLRHGQSYNDRRAPIHIARFIRETLGIQISGFFVGLIICWAASHA